MNTTAKEEIAALHKLDVPALVTRFKEVFGRSPRSSNRQFLLKRVGHGMQIARCGGLSEVARKRLADLMSEIELPDAEDTVTGTLKTNGKRGGPVVGTTYSRIWHGREIRVTAMDGGYECDGFFYKSLSAAVRGITGARWNPSIFLGLKPRRRAKV